MSYWILQSNPAKFRILDWLREFAWTTDDHLIDCWSISFFAKQVQPEDVVFIWKSKGDDATRGIYASGKLVLIPAKFPLEEQEKLYFLDRDEMRRLDTLTQIAVKYTDLYLENPLLEDAINKVPSLRTIPILSNHRHGICRVSDVQGRTIESMAAALHGQIP